MSSIKRARRPLKLDLQHEARVIYSLRYAHSTALQRATFNTGDNTKTLSVTCFRHDIDGIRYLTQLQMTFSDPSEHRFRYNFHCLSPLFIRGSGEENNEHFLLHCGPRYVNQRKNYLAEVSNLVGSGIFELT